MDYHFAAADKTEAAALALDAGLDVELSRVDVYGEPLAYHERFGPEGADDARLVHYLARQVRRAVQQLVDRNRP